jgi:glycosyltransferase involved in cell wall biosynthesis
VDRTLVSVVAPVYNESAVVRELVDRLSAVADGLADRHDFEFVLTDDGSEDGSLEVLTELIQALASGALGWLIGGGLLIVLAAWSFLLGFAAELLVRGRLGAGDDRGNRVRRVYN